MKKLLKKLRIAISFILLIVIITNNSIYAINGEKNVFTLTKEEYKKLSATELAKLVREKKVTPKQLLDLAYEIIDETDKIYNNIIKTNGNINQKIKERAYKDAESMPYTGQPFYGVPLLIKGLTFKMENGNESMGLKYLSEKTSKKDNSLVTNFTKLGFIPIAQTTVPQLGWINVTNSDLFGITKNPWNPDKNPGGSSGGSAAGIVAGQTPVATANDAGGSIRIPASFSGLIGYFPSGGAILGNSASKNFQLENFVLGKSMDDILNISKALSNKKTPLNDIHLDKTKVIAYSFKTPANTPIIDEAIIAVKNCVDFLKSKGFILEEVDYPIDGKEMMKNYYINAAGTAAAVGKSAKSILKRELNINDVELLTWGLYQAGNKLDRNDIVNARKNLSLFREQMDNFYKKYQAFITPTTAYEAPEASYNHLNYVSKDIREKMIDMSNLSKAEAIELIYNQWLPAWTITPFTQLSNVTDTPSISLPTHITKNNMPLGVLFSADRLNDNIILELAKLFQENGKFFIHKNISKAKLDSETSETKDENIDESLNETKNENIVESSNETNNENIVESSNEADNTLMGTSETLNETQNENSIETKNETKSRPSDTSTSTGIGEAINKNGENKKNNPINTNNSEINRAKKLNNEHKSNPKTGDIDIFIYVNLFTLTVYMYILIKKKIYMDN